MGFCTVELVVCWLVFVCLLSRSGCLFCLPVCLVVLVFVFCFLWLKRLLFGSLLLLIVGFCLL